MWFLLKGSNKIHYRTNLVVASKYMYKNVFLSVKVFCSIGGLVFTVHVFCLYILQWQVFFSPQKRLGFHWFMHSKKNVFLGKLTSSRGCCSLLNCLKMIHNPMCMTHNVCVLFRLAVASNIINWSTASVSRNVWGVVLYWTHTNCWQGSNVEWPKKGETNSTCLSFFSVFSVFFYLK